MSIDKFIVSEETPIVEIMKRIDGNAKGIVYVCDSNGVLLGAVTDGDIRRSIISNGRLDEIASLVMKTNPIVLQESERNLAEQVMNEKVN